MPIELKMPALSPTMEKGTLAKWLVRVGDEVKIGDLLAEIETDKATMELEAETHGYIMAIVMPDGAEDIAVGTVIATIRQEGEMPAPDPTAPACAPEIQVEREETPVAVLRRSAPSAVPSPSPSYATDVVINASPLARRFAEARGISLSTISGSGTEGRILKRDLSPMSRISPPLGAVDSGAPSITHGPPRDVPHSLAKLTGMRKTIAKRLTESKQRVPHFYLTAHCNINALLTLRAELNDSLRARGTKLSVNDIVLKAMALAMRREPDVNVQFAGEEMYRFDRVDIAMAVAIDGGLITPVIRDVDSLALSAIADQSKMLTAKARRGRLLPEDYQGGTASISNLGMFGIDEIFPVINPPQALILGVGSGIEKPWKVDGAIALTTIMTATASFDHRAIDGAAAARFMAALRDLLEQPAQILC